MSGGSWDYMHMRVELRLEEHIEEFDRMTERLNQLGRIEGANLFGEFVTRYKAILEEWRRISPIVQAVEWHDSNDWGIDQVADSIRQSRMLHQEQDGTMQDDLDERLDTLLHLCGCTGDDALNFLSAIFPKAEWTDTPIISVDAVVEAVRANPQGAAEVIVQWANSLDLLEHGSSHRHSWFTPHGHEAALYLHEGDQ